MWILLREAPLGARRPSDPCLDTRTEPTTWPDWWWCAPDSSNELPMSSSLRVAGNHLSRIRTNHMLLLALSSLKWRVSCLLSAWETSALLTSHPEKGCHFQVSPLHIPCGPSCLGLPLASLVHGCVMQVIYLRAGTQRSGSSCSVKMLQLELMVKPRDAAAFCRGWGMTARKPHYLPAGTWL